MSEVTDQVGTLSATSEEREHNQEGIASPLRQDAPKPSRPRLPPHQAPELGAGDAIGAEDSYLVTNILPDALATVAFERLKTEVKWDTMYHRGMLLTSPRNLVID